MPHFIYIKYKIQIQRIGARAYTNSESHVKKLTLDKLAPKTNKCLFVGYPRETKGHYFYNPDENKVSVARKAVFLQKEFIFKKNSGSKV